MDNVLVDKQCFTDIANAICEINKEETKYKPSEMAPAIRSISGGGVVHLKCNIDDGATVTATLADGDYSASAVSVDGIADVELKATGIFNVTGTMTGKDGNGITKTETINVRDHLLDFSFATITAICKADSTVTCSKDSYSYSKAIIEDESRIVFYIPEFGTWTVSDTNDNSYTVEVSEYINYNVDLTADMTITFPIGAPGNVYIHFHGGGWTDENQWGESYNYHSYSTDKYSGDRTTPEGLTEYDSKPFKMPSNAVYKNNNYSFDTDKNNVAICASYKYNTSYGLSVDAISDVTIPIVDRTHLTPGVYDFTNKVKNICTIGYMGELNGYESKVDILVQYGKYNSTLLPKQPLSNVKFFLYPPNQDVTITLSSTDSSVQSIINSINFSSSSHWRNNKFNLDGSYSYYFGYVE